MSYLLKGIAVIIAIVFHEMAHGYASHLLGYPTPESSGRLSVNPLNHLDPIGTLCLFFFGFGWAKPVGINSRYYKNEKLGTCIVALAGPLMNFAIACLCAFLLNFITNDLLGSFLYILLSINIGLGCFNLVPFPPLDGSKVLATILPDKPYWQFMSIERYSMFILMIALYTGILNPVLNILYDLAFKLVSLFVF